MNEAEKKNSLAASSDGRIISAIQRGRQMEKEIVGHTFDVIACEIIFVGCRLLQYLCINRWEI